MTKSDDSSSASSAAKRRLWLRLLLGALCIVALSGASTLWLMAHLDHPWVKGKVEQALSSALGTEVRYGRLSLSPRSGLEVEELVLATPASLRGHAPEMLKLDALGLSVELGPLLHGEVVIPEIRGRGLTLTIVVADDGRDSLNQLDGSQDTSEPDESGTAPASLSHSLEALQALSLRVGRVRLAPIRARVLYVAGDTVVTDSELGPVAIASKGLVLGEILEGALSLGPDEGNHVMLRVHDLGDSTSEPKVREAALVPRIEARLKPDRTAALSVSVELLEQSLYPEHRPIEKLVRIDANAYFQPEQARTKLELSELTLLDSMLTATATAVIQDDYSTRVDGEGAVEAASLPWALPWLSLEGLSSELEISELALGPGGVTGGRALFEGQLRAARFTEGRASYELRGARWSGALGTPDSATGTLGTLEVDSSLDHVRMTEPGLFDASIERLATVLELRAVGADDAGMLGLKGNCSLDGSIARVSVDSGTRTRARNASLELDVDLLNQRIEGRVPVQWLTFRAPGSKRVAMRRADLGVVALDPLDWGTGEGRPSVQVDGSVGRVSLGDKHFRVKAWGTDVRRPEPGQYALQSRIRADRLSWGNFHKDRESSLALDAVIDTSRRTVDATAAFSIAGGAQSDLRLKASHDHPATRYTFELAGSQAGPLLGWLLFDDGGQRTDELDFRFKSRGALRGLFYEDPSGALAVSNEPLRTLEGTHESKLEVQQASLSRQGIRHELGGLRISTQATHEPPGRGHLELQMWLDEARFGEAGWEFTLRDYEHQVETAYAALHGAPSFAIQTRGTIGEMRQPYFRQYPLENATFGADVDVDDTRVIAIREAYFRNPAGGTRFEARAAYEGSHGALQQAEVCSVGTPGCPEVTSMYGRESAVVTGTLEQDFSFWRSTKKTKSGGSFRMPFTLESGDLSTYRVSATAELRDVVLELPQYGLLIDDLDALIPLEQEIATRPRLFVVPANTANAMAQKRFFDLYPFTKRDSFFTVDQVRVGRETLGPVAANLQVVGSSLAMDQLHAAYRGGFITGQILGDLSRDDPKLVFRGNVTGVEATEGRGVLDANLAMTFVPTTLILEGKAQVIRISKDHLYEVIDTLDPYHEDEDLNRVRLGLKFGYPKFVQLKMDEGLMNAKIDLGGLAGAVRIDEIKGIPVTPLIEQYVQPYLERVLSPTAAAKAMIQENEGI